MSELHIIDAIYINSNIEIYVYLTYRIRRNTDVILMIIRPSKIHLKDVENLT